MAETQNNDISSDLQLPIIYEIANSYLSAHPWLLFRRPETSLPRILLSVLLFPLLAATGIFHLILGYVLIVPGMVLLLHVLGSSYRYRSLCCLPVYYLFHISCYILFQNRLVIKDLMTNPDSEATRQEHAEILQWWRAETGQLLP